METPEFLRELRPHAIWWVVESVMLAGLTGVVQAVRAVPLDWVVLGTVVLGGFLLLWWEQGRTTAFCAYSLIGTYDSDEMHTALRVLSCWQQTYKETAGDEFRRRLQEKYDEEADTVNHARRRVSGYFQEVCHCWDLHLLTKKRVRRVANKDQVKFYREVVEPLEEALNPAYDRTSFDRLGVLYGIESQLSMTRAR